MRVLLGVLLIIVCPALSWGQAVHYLDTLQHTYKFEVQERILGNGVREVEYTYVRPRSLNDYRLPILIGRDLDRDGKIDAWFPLTSPSFPMVIDLKHKPSTGDGWEEAQKILLNASGLGSKPISQVLIDSLGVFLFLAKDAYDNCEAHTLERELTLLSLEVGLNRQKNDPALTRTDRLQIAAGYQDLSDQWIELSRRLERVEIPKQMALAITNGFFLLPLPDIFGFVLKGAQSVSETLPTFLQNAWIKMAAQIAKYSGTIANKANAINIILGNTFLGRASIQATAAAADRLALAQERYVLARALGNFLGAAWKNRKYVAGASIVLQIPAEMFVNWERLHDSKDRSTKKFLNNFIHDKTIQQDLLFMFIETILQTGILEGGNPTTTLQILKRVPWASLGSLIDSLSVGRLIKGKTEPGRTIMDVLWETTIGVGQTTFDRYMSRKVGPLAQAIEVTINQAMGYVMYGLVSKWYEHGGGKEWFQKKLEHSHIKGEKVIIPLDGEPPPELINSRD